MVSDENNPLVIHNLLAPLNWDEKPHFLLHINQILFLKFIFKD